MVLRWKERAGIEMSDAECLVVWYADGGGCVIMRIT